MGCANSSLLLLYPVAAVPHFEMIPDRFATYDDVEEALRSSGLESSQLVIGVDFTKSNLWTGKRTFNGRSLHDVQDQTAPTPYVEALTIIANALWSFDDDHLIPAYGFGDEATRNKRVFSFEEDGQPCKGLPRVLERYQEIASSVCLSGPTSFAPLIRQAIQLVRETNEYHILLILADGQVEPQPCVQETTEAIVEASNYALSIIMVGVGDGPWDLMDKFDDELPQRRFDNFQFVDFNTVFHKYPEERREAAFACHALMEVPDQYQAIKKFRLLREGRRLPAFAPPPAPRKPPRPGQVPMVTPRLREPMPSPRPSAGKAEVVVQGRLVSESVSL